MKTNVSDYIADFLSHQGVGHVFEMAGGMITHLLDSIHNAGLINIISVHHEQAAAFAADAYGRCTGNIGVAFATSGPGATNLLTGIASCHFDSIPALFITGQVNTHEQKGDRLVRQLGFQETDIAAMASTITKKCYRLTNANQIESVLSAAYLTAISGRPGPVLIDIPMNLQKQEIHIQPIKKLTRLQTPSLNHSLNIEELLSALAHAKKPLILAGRGIKAANAAEKFLQLINQLAIPVVTTLLGMDTLPFDHPLRVGFIGSYGNRWANLAIGASDLLIVMGSRLDIRQTGADVDAFANNKKIFHIDCDAAEVNNRLKNCIPMMADISDFIDQLLLSTHSFAKPTWHNEITQLKQAWPDTDEIKNISGINPNIFMHALSSQSRDAAGYVADVGNHQMWAAQSLDIRHKQFFITSGGMGAMGYALPAAIGASLAHNKQPVIVIAGDGGFQLNIQEMQTIIRNKLPIKIIVMNNNSLGMIRQFQDNYFNSRYQSTYWGYSAPNFELIAKAYGITAQTISQTSDIEQGISSLMKNNGEPALLQVMVDLHANAYPKIAFGKPITDMEPFVKPVCMEGT